MVILQAFHDIDFHNRDFRHIVSYWPRLCNHVSRSQFMSGVSMHSVRVPSDNRIDNLKQTIFGHDFMLSVIEHSL